MPPVVEVIVVAGALIVLSSGLVYALPRVRNLELELPDYEVVSPPQLD